MQQKSPGYPPGDFFTPKNKEKEKDRTFHDLL